MHRISPADPGAGLAAACQGGTPGAAYRLAAVVALYAAYLAVYFVLGTAAFSAQGYYWHDDLVILLTLLALAQAGWRSDPPLRLFLLCQAASLLLLVVTDASYGRDLPLWTDAQGKALQLTNVAYVVYLFGWSCAWVLLLLLPLVRWRRPGGRTVAVFALLMAGFAGLFLGFYTPLYRDGLAGVDVRLNVAIAVLELLAVVTGLAAMLLGVGTALVLQVFGITLLAASDMLYSAAEARGATMAAADPVWMLGLCTLLAGALALPGGSRRRRTQAPQPGSATRSGLSTLLLALSLGAVLLTAVVSLALRSAGDAAAPAPSAGEPFFFMLSVVGLVVVMVWLTDRFDRAVDHAGRYAQQLLGQRLRAPPWRDTDRRLAWILDATGLGQMLDTLTEAAARLRRDVLFLGPERLNPAPQEAAPDAEPSCFIIMPFALPESDAVHRVLRQVCLDSGLRPLRGDDLFTPTDILDDIWRGITGARCVIADISGRNPNVMYELGIAHTLAKPVLILSRNADDIPIDLATRRVILYGTAADAAGQDWQATLAERAAAAVRALLKDYAHDD